MDNASGKVLFFIHTFKNDFEITKSYIDVYTEDKIYHFDNKFSEISPPTDNIFGEVPVTIGKLTEEGTDDSLYSDIKGLQDALETNLSDVGNEISDFRNAYLLFKNAQIDETNIPHMKELGIIQFPGTGGDAAWLIKDINDTFIQNTLDRYEDTMYQLACHINHNEKLQSNSDDLATAQMLSQVPKGVISRDTARGLFSFINNKVAEAEKVKKELNEKIDLGNGYNDIFSKGSN